MKTLEDCNETQYISKRRKRHFYKKKKRFLCFRTIEMSWFQKVFSSQSSQETKVAYQKAEDEKSDETYGKREKMKK